MPNVNGLVIKLPENRRHRFYEYVAHSFEFGEPVPYFEHGNTTPLLCFVINSRVITHIAYGKGGKSAGSGLRRVNMHPIVALHKPIPSTTILSTAPKNLAARLSADLENGGLLTPKCLEHVINVLMELASETQDMLLQFFEHLASIIRDLAPEARFNLAMQKEAVLTAFLVAGQNFDRTVRGTPQNSDRSVSYTSTKGERSCPNEKTMLLRSRPRWP